MPAYVLSARLEVAGAKDFIDDLDKATRAARDTSDAFKKLKGLDVAINLRGAKDFDDDATRAALAAYDLDDALEKLKAQSSAISLDGAAKFLRQLDEVQLAIIKAKDYFDEFNRDPIHLDRIAGIETVVADLKDLRQHTESAVTALKKLRELDLNLDVNGADEAIADISRVEEVAMRMVRTFNVLESDPLNLGATGIAELRSDLELADAAAAGLDRSLRGINTAKIREAADETSKLHQIMGNLGRGLAYSAMDRVFDTVADGAADAAREVVAFDEKLKNALSITASGTNLAQLEGEFKSLARSISKDLGTPVSEVAAGFYDLISAGLTMDEVMAGIEPAARFAKGGLIDLEDAVHKGAQAFAIFKNAANEAGGTGYTMQQIFDALAQASNVSQGDIDTFADALTNKAGTAAYNFGQTLETTLGVLAAFHERGVEGKVAGEQYSIVLRDMRIKAIKNAEAFERMGISVFDSSGNMRQLTDIIPDVQQAFAGMNDKMAQAELLGLGFTLRSSNVILSLIGMGDRASYFKDKMLEADGAVDRMVNIQLTSLQSMLDRLRAYSIDLAIVGLDKLFDVGAFLRDTFRPALEAIAPAAEAFARGIGGVASAVGPLVGGAIVAGIQGIATAIEAIGNFASQHLGAVQTFGEFLALIAVGGTAAYLAGPLLAGFSSVMGAAKLSYGAIQTFVVEMLTVKNTGSYLDVLKAGWEGLGDSIRRNPTVAIGLFVAAMAGMANEVRKNQQDAEDWANAIAGAFDTTTLGGMASATLELEKQAVHAREAAKETRGFGDFLKTTADIIPFIDFENTSIDLYDAAKAAEEMARQMRETATESNGVVNALADWASNGQVFGPIVGNVDEVRAKIQELGAASGLAGGEFQISADRLRRIGEANNIDFARPWQEWLPKLYDVAIAQSGVAEALRNVGVSAADADALASTMADSTSDMGDAAGDAAEQFDALTEAIRGMVDGPLQKFASDTSFQGAMADFVETTKEAGLNLDAATESGRKTRDALVGLVDEALNWAEAQATMPDGTKDMGLYAEKVGEAREALINLITPLAGSRDAAEALVNQLGLVPETKDVAIAVNAEGLAEAQAGLDAAATDRNTRITAVADTEIANDTLDGWVQVQRTVGVMTDVSISAANDTLDGWVQTKRATTVITEADVNPAETKVQAVVTAPRTITISTGADTGPADTKLTEVTTRPRVATVLTEAQVAGAEVALAALTTARRVVTFEATDNGSSAGLNAGFDYTARKRDAWVDVTDFGAGAALNAGLDYLARARTAYLDVIVRTYNSDVVRPDGGIAALADGGVVEYYARGGMRESHVAQIAPANTMRVWAEPETGGEAYIPLSPAKRQRSLKVWEETGKRLGVQGFADGGLTQSAARSLGQAATPVVVTVSPGAIQANVSAAVGADPSFLADRIQEAIKPALDEFALDLATTIRRQR